MTNYFDLQIDLVKLQVKEQLVEILTAFVVMIMVISMGLFIILFLSIGVGILLNDYFQSSYLGFLSVALFFVVICALTLIFRDKLIANPFFRVFFEKTMDESLNKEEDERP